MNKLKFSFINEEITFGNWIQIPYPGIAECMRGDWTCIDAEHGIFDLDSIANIIRVITDVPIVRIPKLDEIWVHRVLDLGAQGLIVPMIKTKEDVDKLIEYAKYPPIGNRGYGYCRQNNYGDEDQSWSKMLDENLSIVVQIEHIDAIVNLEEILDNKYIDGSFIGPLDLRWSIKNDSPYSYEEALEKYRNISREMGKPTGFHVIDPIPENIQKAVEDGYKMIALGLDVTHLRNSSSISYFEGKNILERLGAN